MKVPSWLTGEQQREWWRKPWTVPQSSDFAREFKSKLWAHGFASPNFRRAETKGNGGNPLATPAPDSLRHECQFHAFGLERVRHALGGRPMAPLNWYRNPRHNAAVGGASQSAHLRAWATDWTATERARLGGEKFDEAMEYHFRRGGRGYQGHVGGPIRHVDNGSPRTWVY